MSQILVSLLFQQCHSKANLKMICGIIMISSLTFIGVSIIPNLTQELMLELSNVWLSVVNILGCIFALSSHALAYDFQPLLSKYLEMYRKFYRDSTIMDVKYVNECILSNPFRFESSLITTTFSDWLLDSKKAIHKKGLLDEFLK